MPSATTPALVSTGYGWVDTNGQDFMTIATGTPHQSSGGTNDVPEPASLALAALGLAGAAFIRRRRNA